MHDLTLEPYFLSRVARVSGRVHAFVRHMRTSEGSQNGTSRAPTCHVQVQVRIPHTAQAGFSEIFLLPAQASHAEVQF